ncbi:AMED_5909 family protein [Actinokineospora sp. UTMC 2448]|uniref:AMED_5909 family protein n=1 Tax=Actinokineospora sp. UTMC 2448 TaxID=2268449 RepID=UPI002164CD17|nr:AMED_5909 family protein [Actinokineospora sp. UTMC 2448]UVS81703.1 hypothetical protein Actkin_05467 [Actinokineospora sp. UTMC 2448]
MSESSTRPVIAVGIGEVCTLAGAHEALRALLPKRTAPASEWEHFYRQSSRVYAAVAEVDKAHHHEALGYWSNRTREIADEISRTGQVPTFRFEF